MSSSIIQYMVFFFMAYSVTNMATQSCSRRRVSAAEGLNLLALSELVKETKSPEELERKLNDPSVGVNNLDLDKDGKVDYLNVAEYGDNKIKGLSFYVELGPDADQLQEVATVNIKENEDGSYDVEVSGNDAIYGRNTVYRRNYSGGMFRNLAMFYFMNRMMNPYRSSYGYGRRPMDYRSYEPASREQYSKRNKSYDTSAYKKAPNSTMSNKPRSPNAMRNARNVKAPLKSPTSAQKRFQRTRSMRTKTYPSSRRRYNGGGFRFGK